MRNIKLIWIIIILLNCLIIFTSGIYSSDVDDLSNWSPEIQIDDSFSSNMMGIYNNNVHIMWGGYYYRSIDNGNTFQLQTPPISEIINEQTFSVYKKNIHFIWGNDQGLWYKRSEDNGDSWSQSIYLDQFGNSGEWISICSEETNVYVVYGRDARISNPLIETHVFFLKSTDNGNSWSEPLQLSTREISKSWNKIVTNGEYVYVIWTEYDYNANPEIKEIHYRRSTNKGISWENEMVLYDNGVISDIFVNKNFLHFICHENISDEIIYRRSVDNGLTWSNKQNLGFMGAGDLSIAANDTVVFIAVGGSPNINLKYSSDNGLKFSSNILLVAMESKSVLVTSDLVIEQELNSIHLMWVNWYGGSDFRTFYKRTLPNLVPINIEITNYAILDCESDIEVKVKNNGLADVYNLKIDLFDNSKYVTSKTIIHITTTNPQNIYFKWTPDSVGEHELKVQVDPSNNILEINENDNNLTKKINVVKNEKPVASIDIVKNEYLVKENIIFDGSKSYDSDGDIESYFFNFGDGNNSGWIEQSSINHNYSLPGKYTSNLKVKDNYGQECEKVAEIFVNIIPINLQPRIRNISADKYVTEPNKKITITVDAYDPDLDDIFYIYESSDGTFTGNDSIVTWTAPGKGGVYKIKVKVFDGQLYSGIKSINVTVEFINYLTIIKSISIEPDNIYNNELHEIMIEIEIEDNNGLEDIHSVLIDLKDINGLAKQKLFDDGTNGDEVEDDGIFSLKFTVEKNVKPGIKHLTIEITDSSGNKVYDNATMQVIDSVDNDNIELYVSSGVFILIIVIVLIIFISITKRKRNKDKKLKSRSKRNHENEVIEVEPIDDDK